jgi:subtilisin family serine protease
MPDLGPYDRIRVEIPDYPGALVSSDYGSVLAEIPPEDIRYSMEDAPQTDVFTAWEAIDALAAAPWHQQGLTGAGVKLAVFDVQWFNAALSELELGEYQTRDCEAHRSCEISMDTLRPRYSFEEGSHGVACAEVIRDLAPGAELYLVRVNGQTTLENAAAWAVREEIDLVSMSMSFFNNSFYDGSGAINAAADRMRNGGVLLVNSAGNYATEHWDGDFTDNNNDTVMEFPWGSSYLPLYFNSGSRTVYLSWDQFKSCGDTDLDMYLYAQNGTLLGKSENIQEEEGQYCAPLERISADIPSGDWTYLQIVLKNGDPHVHLAVFARDGSAWNATPGSIADPGSSVSAFTVGAVRASGYLENGPESFSSLGPTHGGIAKPDIAGPDGLSTSIYGSIGFYGTSASTPATAAAIALVMEANPGFTAFDAAEYLQINALWDGSLVGPVDGALGAGKARLPAETERICGGSAALLLFPGIWWRRRLIRRSCR